MQRPRVRVLLADPLDVAADVVVLPAAHARSRPGERCAWVAAPRWKAPDGPERLLAQAYRDAVAEANAREARSLALPGILARTAFPLDQVTRVALTVLLSTPTTVHEVIIAVRTPAMLERWAEALAREW